jgi:dTDP-4-dehydrorhamnose reductase
MLARQENDPTGPLNAYGRSKLEGERQVLAASGRNIILRTSWVYDAEGVNFLNTMLRLGREKETLNVVSDQFGAPTYANDLAEGIQQILSLWLDKGSNAEGIYHLTNAGSVSWHGFAEAIFNHASQFESLKIKDLRAVSSTEYPSAIKRPLNSRLDCHKAEVELGVKLRSWEAALGACLKQKYLNKLS